MARLGWTVQPTDTNDDQLMRPKALARAFVTERQALIDAEAVLLIDDYEPQAAVCDIALE